MNQNNFTVKEALGILKNSLERCGLQETTILINSYGLTMQESNVITQNLLEDGFGEAIAVAKEDYPYTSQASRYSWVTVKQGYDEITLFYDVEVAS